MLVRNGLRLALAASSALLLSGCLTFGKVDRRATLINEGVGAGSNRAVLLNLVRASRSEPLYFLSVTTLHATSTGDLKLGLPQATLGPVDLPKVQVAQNYTFGSNASNILDNNTTTSFDVGVLNSKDFYNGLLAPLGVEDVDLLLHQGFSRELVFDLVIDHAKITEVTAQNDHKPLRPPYVVYNDPTAAGFALPLGFEYFIQQAMIHGLTTETVSGSGAATEKAEGSPAKGIPELLSAVAAALTKKPSSPKVALCYEPALAAPDAQVQSDLTGSKSICGQKDNQPASDQASAPLFVNLTTPDGKTHYLEIEVTTRSIFGIFNYLGEMIANRDEAEVRLHQYTTVERSNTDPILTLVNRGGDLGGCFTAVTYAGGRYCVPQEGSDNTKRVFAMLNMLIALKQSPGDLPTTQTVRIEQ
jgi:hypothetical protein